MLNLLTVIISIALTAVMGAAGIVYVGSVFLSAGPKAAANGIIQSMAQIQAAWTLYSSDAKTTSTTAPTMSAAGVAGQDLIVDKYLAAVPTAPTIAATYGAAGAGAAAYQLDLSATSGPGIFIVLASTAGQQCLEIARAGGMVSSTGTLAAPLMGAVPNLETTVTTNALLKSTLANFKFGCVGVGGAGISLAGTATVAADAYVAGPPVVEKYIAYYKY